MTSPEQDDDRLTPRQRRAVDKTLATRAREEAAKSGLEGEELEDEEVRVLVEMVKGEEPTPPEG